VDYEDINSILNSILETYADGAGYDVVWEDTKYDPVQGTTYLEQYFLPGESDSLFSGQTDQGLYQININVELDNGRGRTLVIVKALIAAYGRSVFVSGKGRVGITRTFLSTPQKNNGFFTEIMNVAWEVA